MQMYFSNVKKYLELEQNMRKSLLISMILCFNLKLIIFVKYEKYLLFANMKER